MALDPTAVHSVNPGIVYCSLSGYGQTGPYRDRPGHDLDYLAVSGMLSLLGPRGTRPTPPGLQIADIAGGTLAALEILAALVRRVRTGDGATLDVAVLDAVVSWLAPLGAGLATAGEVSGPLGGTFPCYTVYQTSDGAWLAVGALEPQFWVSFCRGLGREDLVSRQYDPTAVDVLARCLSERTADEWLRTLDDDACVARVNLPSQAELDPQVRVRGIVVGEGDDTRVVTPLRAATHDAGAQPAPGLGEHTFQILGEAGLEAHDIRALEAASVDRRRRDPRAAGACDATGLDAREDGRARARGTRAARRRARPFSAPAGDGW